MGSSMKRALPTLDCRWSATKPSISALHRRRGPRHLDARLPRLGPAELPPELVAVLPGEPREVAVPRVRRARSPGTGPRRRRDSRGRRRRRGPPGGPGVGGGRRNRAEVHGPPREVAERGEHGLPDFLLAARDRDEVEVVGDVRPAHEAQHGAIGRRGLVEGQDAHPLAGAVLGGEEVERSGGEGAEPGGLELPRRERQPAPDTARRGDSSPPRRSPRASQSEKRSILIGVTRLSAGRRSLR